MANANPVWPAAHANIQPSAVDLAKLEDQPSGVGNLTIGQAKKLAAWEAACTRLEQAKIEEMELRKSLKAALFPDKREGTHRVPLANGHELKLGAKLNYKLADRKQVEPALDAIAQIGNQGGFVADRLVKWSCTLVLSEYRLLEAPDATAEQKLIKAEIDKVLTIDEAAPSLEIVEPKRR